MTDIACALIAAAATVLCAVVAAQGKRQTQIIEKHNAESDARAIQRAKEGKLMLRMIAANTKLTIGIADCLKSGKANGNIDGPLQEVQDAQHEYVVFLEGVAIDQLHGGAKK